MALLQVNDVTSSNRNDNSSSGSEEYLKVSTPKKCEDDNHVSNAPHCAGYKARVVTDKTKIDSVRALSAMNDDHNYYNHDNVVKGKN